jgi:6-phosphogluconolactonase (cycloisomerase 2 family)
MRASGLDFPFGQTWGSVKDSLPSEGIMNRNRRTVLAAFAMLATAVIAVGCCTPEKVVSPIPNFAYTSNENSNNISAYALESGTGVLTPVTGSPFAGPTGPRDSVVELFGKFLYVSNGGTNGVSGFSIDHTTGELSPVSGSPFAGGMNPRGIALHPSGKFLYTADRGSNTVATVSGYAINTDTGELTTIAGSPFIIPPEGETQVGPQQLTVDPTGRFLYVSNHLTGDITGFRINGSTGALTLISGSPFTDEPQNLGGGLQPYALVASPSGAFLYVSNHGRSTLSVFSIDAVTGALTGISGSPFVISPPPESECSASPFGLALTPSGQFLYVAENNCGAIAVFSVDTTTGIPTQTKNSPFRINACDGNPLPLDDTLDFTGRFLYVANQGCGNISGYSVNLTTGDLTELPGSPYPAGNTPYGLAISRIN